MKKAGTVLVMVLVIIAALAVVTGVIESVWPAPQLSPVSQQFLSPGEPISKSPFSFLSDLKNKKVKLDVIKVTSDVVSGELDAKIGRGQTAYDRFIGTFDNPGLAYIASTALLTAIGTTWYNKSKLYTANEVKLIKGGETVL